MRELAGNFAEVEGLDGNQVPVGLDIEDARTIALGLKFYNDKLVEEYNKIANTPDVSQFLVDAAHKQYQEMTERGTKLHVALAQLFPELTQR